MLILDLVRHGEAVAHHPGGDAARPLTPRGESDIRRLAEALRADGWAPAYIAASPYLRAQQTAQLLADACDRTVATWGALEPDTPPQRVLDALLAEGWDAAAHVVLVAHLPLVERVALALAAGDAPWTPGTLARIELPEGLARRGALTRVWTP